MSNKHENIVSLILALIPQRTPLLIILLAITSILLLTTTVNAQVTDWEDLIALSMTLYQQGEHLKAINTMRESVKAAIKTFGANHHTVTISMKNLALLYSEEGKYSEAESLYKKAILMEEKFLGRNHPVVAEDLRTMAEMYKYQGKNREAESLYKRAHAIEEKMTFHLPTEGIDN
jgi:tetratricopeptide (TPR) repeat protein